MSHDEKGFQKLPLWRELPSFNLHLDQLLDITNAFLEPITEERITKTMMHNYFKASIIDAPIKKKYQRKQLAGAIIVGLLKNVFSLSEIRQGLSWLLVDASPAEGYDNFVKMFNEQASQKQLETTHITSINLEVATNATLMQYTAVQSILFWLLTRRILEENQASIEK
ncbi:hypothetical protein G8J22_02570 [Lentilactobacillus hilgardii]|uniref:DUF1836 domain-containing protein n=1 Tax=Lentilactobacillus hilgardii TaxID=1588 RepID=UPI00019C4E68|nr:DUF1836 domain-containing protein [Lentilactobacillus hilgardii]EEI21149.1 hypothetical protein HMPREF0497_0047 [Lentilactobacillus buchneri ATCC 11577]MCT3396081.1 DUF1836 domain-containing protein [Lentilactobacillus hilgardii]QIR10559.1 hypothetical protein G8J22_02570 [Lentilactobacillus hilgardii]